MNGRFDAVTDRFRAWQGIPIAAQLAVWVLALVCLALLAWFVRHHLVNRSVVPFWDGVSVYSYLDGTLSGHRPNLWRGEGFTFIDNEHKPVFPMFVWQADYYLFGSKGLMPMLMAYAMAAVTFALIGLKAAVRLPLAYRVMFVLAGLAIAFSPMNYSNLTWQKQLHVYMSLLFSTLALWVVCIRSGRAAQLARPWSQALEVAAAGVLGFVASFSFGYGMVVWPVAIAGAAMSRWRWPHLLLLATFAAGTIALYLQLWTTNPHHDDPAKTILHPVALYEYVCHFLMAPFTPTIRLFDPQAAWSAAMVGGTILLVNFAWQALREYVLNFGPGNRDARFCLSVGAFGLGVALITALGRVNITGLGEVSRYLVASLMFAVAMPGMREWEVTRPQGLRKAGLAAFAIVLVIAALGSVSFFREAMRYRTLITTEGALAAEFRLSSSVHGIFPAKDMLDDHIWPSYRKLQNRFGRLLPMGWLGKSVESRLDNETICPGSMVLRPVKDMPGAYHIEGWARFGEQGEQVPEWILVTDDRNRMVGLGQIGRWRDDVATHLRERFPNVWFEEAARSGVVGFVRAEPGQRMRAYASHDNATCLVTLELDAPQP
ncbi:MAG: hypothetical protein VYD64_05255 [Pseudomonadota bacterium]|nr:hypothetical protein [Pseudomonadota bacterium]